MTRDSRRVRRLATLGLVTAVVCTALPLGADERPNDLERQVKAAFVYKFASYVIWPASAFPRPDAPFVIGVMGDDAIEDDLTRVVSDRSLAGHGFTVRMIPEGASLEGVHMLFVAGRDPRRLARAIAALAAQPCLVVTEAPGALGRGSIINFVIDNGHVRFEISKAAANDRGLALSSQLLSVALSVVTGTP